MTVENQVAYWKRRCRDAEWRQKLDAREVETTTRWAQKAFDEQRRLGERLTFVYGVAIAHGATREELTGDA